MLAVAVLLSGLGIVGVIMLGRTLDSRAWSRSLVAYRLTMPAGLPIEAVIQWLADITAITQAPRLALLPGPPVAVEVVASRQGVDHVLLMPRRLEAAILGSLRAALPGVRLSQFVNYRDERPRCVVAGELTMTNRLRPLGVERGPGTSAALLAAIQPLRGTETVVLQWIFTSAGTPAPIRSAGGRQTGSGSLLEHELADPEAVRAARLKQTEPTLHVSGRLGVVADSRPAAYRLFGQAFGPLRGLNAQGVMVLRRWWLPSAVAGSRLQRLTLPVVIWPLLLQTSELAGLLGLPVGELALPGLTLGAARHQPPPPDMATSRDAATIGSSNYPGLLQPIRLHTVDRLMHTHVVGPTGVGKSTLLANLILQDIAAGRGLIVIDPKSDLVSDVLDRLPEHRLDDVIVLDPAALSEPIVSFNILQAAHDEHSRELVVDHVIHVWRELYKDFWGPRSEDVLRSAVLTLINTRAMDGSAFTLIETPELLTNASFRRFVLNQPTVPPGVKSFWTWYQRLKPLDQFKVIGPIQNKLRAATLRSPIRLLLGQSRGLDLGAVLAERRILLVPLSAGRLGSETASLLGTLLLSTVYQALLGRTRLPSNQRQPVMIFIDEAQGVLRLPIDLADMLAMARGMGGGFTLAHQHLGQLTDKEVKAALFGTVRSQIVFQCGRDDATVFARSFGPHLTADDLSGLPVYEVAVRPCINGQTRSPLTASTLPLPPVVRDGQAVATSSRSRYGTPRPAVEQALVARLQVPGRPTSAGPRQPSGGPSLGRRPRADRSAEDEV